MIGKVIDGRYAGGSVDKLPDKNVLFIQVEDGTRIAISRSKVISIDDITDQYPSSGRRFLMVMWNDFETSIIQLGTANPAAVSTKDSQTETQPKAKRKTKSLKKKKRYRTIIAISSAIIILFICVFSGMYFINQQKDRNETIEKAKALAYEKVVETIEGALDSSDYTSLTASDFSTIINSISAAYSEPVIKDNTYTLTATYRVDLFINYLFFEFEIIGDFDSDSFNIRFIRDYKSETSAGSNNNDALFGTPEVAAPEEVVRAEPQHENSADQTVQSQDKVELSSPSLAVEMGFLDYTQFDEYWFDGIFRCGTDFVPGDYYILPVFGAGAVYDVSNSPNDFISSGYWRVLRKVSVDEGQYVNIGFGSIMVSADEVDTNNWTHYGVFLVGKDIPAGDYKLETVNDSYLTDLTEGIGYGGFGYYQICSGSPENTPIDCNTISGSQTYLTLKEGQFIVIINTRLTLV